jgi:hypothetical protein
MANGMRGKHQIRSCDYCDDLMCVNCSDAQMSRKYCSAECEALDAEGKAVGFEDRFGYYPTRGTA